jgi:hypothetical protein
MLIKYFLKKKNADRLIGLKNNIQFLVSPHWNKQTENEGMEKLILQSNGI